MSIFFLAAMMMAQAPAAAQPEQPVTIKRKPRQVCEMIEVTGSRARKRVCRDENGRLDLGPGVSAMGVQGKIQQQGGASGGPPGS
jgi:hypothetical protein